MIISHFLPYYEKVCENNSLHKEKKSGKFEILRQEFVNPHKNVINKRKEVNQNKNLYIFLKKK